jgi:ribosome maturation factor RimP
VSDLTGQVWGLVEPYLAAEGVELDDVELHGGGKMLRVVVEAEEPLDVGRIASLSRSISRLIDENDPFPGSYTLEVTSPGLERKLRRPAQYQKSVGSEVAVKTYAPIGEEKHHKGRLVSANDEGIVVDVDGTERSIAYGDVATARTVFVWEKGKKPKKTA